MKHTDALLTTIDATQDEDLKLIDNIDDLEKQVAQAVDVLDDIEDVNNKVKKLDKSTKTIQDVLTPLAVLPGVGTACGNVKNVISNFRKILTPASKNLDRLYGTLKPAHVKLRWLETKLKQTEIKLGDYNNGLGHLEDVIKAAKKCAGKKPACVDPLEAFCEQTRKPIHASYQGFKAVNNTVDEFQGFLEHLLAVRYITNQIDKVMDEIWKVLGEVTKVTNEIEKVLRKKISVPYKFKVKVKVKVTKKKWWKVFTFWEWKWRARTKNFTFRIRDILNGINTGINWVNDQLMKLAKNALKKIGIKTPKLPSLPIDDLTNKLERIKLPNMDSILGSLDVEMPAIDNLLKDFKNPCEA